MFINIKNLSSLFQDTTKEQEQKTTQEVKEEAKKEGGI